MLSAETDMELCIIGLNHRTAPLEFREQLAVPAERVPLLLETLRREAGFEEVVVLSTCNRLEVYGVSSGGPVSAAQVFEAVAATQGTVQSKGFPQLASFLYIHRNEACIQHLFRVASSLDSLVVGETEIVGQVKKAYQLAHASGATGKVLNRLFQKALSVSKEVRTRSGIGRCSTSVGAVAVDLAEKIFGEQLTGRTILIIGAGKIGETTLKHLTKQGVKSILVANRSLERAQDLVAKFQGEAVPFSDLPHALAQADIVISSTSAPDYIIRRGEVAQAMARRPDRALLLIDLAVPRDIDPAALQVSSVYLYNIDQLSELARMNRNRRQAEAAACEQMVTSCTAQVVGALLGAVSRPPRTCPLRSLPVFTGVPATAS